MGRAESVSPGRGLFFSGNIVVPSEEGRKEDGEKAVEEARTQEGAETPCALADREPSLKAPQEVSPSFQRNFGTGFDDQCPERQARIQGDKTNRKDLFRESEGGRGRTVGARMDS